MAKPTIVREPAGTPTTGAALVRVGAGTARPADDAVAVEEPLEIHLNGWRWLVTMRTPGDDSDLIVGLLASEQVIGTSAAIDTIVFSRHPDEPDLANVADVRLVEPLGALQERLGRNQTLATSSCGLCGASAVAAILARRPPLPPGPTIDPGLPAELPARLAAAQPGFRASGGLHAAALFDRDGRLLAAREDVGRHNATDKVLGWRLRAGPPAAAACILLVSGRASFEIVQKALMAEIPIVVAVSAPSSLAVALARDAAITLVGFARGETCNVYTGAERLGIGGDADLAWIPRHVRAALDAVALKISLTDWQRLGLDERRLLVGLASGAPEPFARVLREQMIARTGHPPRPLPPRPDPDAS